jgi:hypothetical protein
MNSSSSEMKNQGRFRKGLTNIGSGGGATKATHAISPSRSNIAEPSWREILRRPPDFSTSVGKTGAKVPSPRRRSNSARGGMKSR